MVIDTLRRFHDADENAACAMTLVLGQLERLAMGWDALCCLYTTPANPQYSKKLAIYSRQAVVRRFWWITSAGRAISPL